MPWRLSKYSAYHERNNGFRKPILCLFCCNEKKKKYYDTINDKEQLWSFANQIIANQQYQQANLLLERLLTLYPNFKDRWTTKGFCEYAYGNYEISKEDNKKSLEIKKAPEALRGYGMSLYQLEDKQQGIACVEEALALTGYKNSDIKQDLQLMRSRDFT